MVDDKKYNYNYLNLKVYTNVRLMLTFEIFAINIDPVPRFSKKKLSKIFLISKLMIGFTAHDRNDVIV